MVDGRDQAVAKGDADQFLKTYFWRKLRLGCAFGDGQLVGAERHIRPDAHPAFNRLVRTVTRRTVPFELFAIGIRQAHRPEENNTLPVDCREQRIVDDLGGKLGNQSATRHQICFAILLQLDHCEVIAERRVRMDADVLLFVRLAYWHRAQELPDARGLIVVLSQPQIREIERVGCLVRRRRFDGGRRRGWFNDFKFRRRHWSSPSKCRRIPRRRGMKRPGAGAGQQHWLRQSAK